VISLLSLLLADNVKSILDSVLEEREERVIEI
jgi:hypothetical protein